MFPVFLLFFLPDAFGTFLADADAPDAGDVEPVSGVVEIPEGGAFPAFRACYRKIHVIGVGGSVAVLDFSGLEILDFHFRFSFLEAEV